MREQHNTHMLEEMVKSVSDRLHSPTKQISEASARRSREVEAASDVATTAADAEAKKTVLYAEGRKAFAVLVALSLVILAVGFAGRMVISALPDKIVETRLTPTPTSPAPTPNWPPAFGPRVSSEDADVITTNFTLFREKSVKLGVKNYEVVAGHKFASETDTTYSLAWCYTNVLEDGLTLKVALGTSMPSQSALIDMPSQAMLTKSGLSQNNIKTLFNNCPWLDGNPNVQAGATETKVYQFREEVTSESVDRLIKAISGGVTVIEFSSPGGLVHEAIRGFAAIQRANVKTVATGDCASACTLLFLGGKERSVAMNGKIGVHQWSTEKGMTYDADAQLTSATLISLIASAGVSEEFYIAGARTPSSELYYLTRAELADWGVVG